MRVIVVPITILLAAASGADLVFVSGRLPTADQRPLLAMTLEDANVDLSVEARRISMGGGRLDFVATVAAAGPTEWPVGGVNVLGLGVVVSIPEEKRGDPQVLRYVAEVTYRWLSVHRFLSDVDIDIRSIVPDPRLEGVRWGVIDAQANAAGYRVLGGGVSRFDAPATTFGYLASDTREDAIRRDRFDRMVQDLAVNARVEARTVIDEMMRDVGERSVRRGDTSHGHPLAGPQAVCTVVINGPARDDDPGLSCMWAVLGHPAVAPALPVWARTLEVPEALGTGYGSDLNREARDRRDAAILPDGGVREDTLAAIRSYLRPLEDLVWGRYRNQMAAWAGAFPDGREIGYAVRDVVAATVAGYKLRAVGTFSGFVRDGVTRAAIPDATVQYFGPANGESRANGSGFYFTPDLPPGTYSLAAYAEDYGNASILDLSAIGVRVVHRDVYLLPRPLTGALYTLDSLVVRDKPPHGTGNGDGLFGPGEEATLVAYVSNTGDRQGGRVEVSVAAELFYFEGVATKDVIPILPNDGVSLPTPSGLRVRAKPNTPPGTPCDLRFTITDDAGGTATKAVSLEIR